MKKPNRRIGVTLMELLLVVGLLAIVAPVTYPVAMDAFSTTNDRPAVNMVKGALTHAFSMGLIGREKESKMILEPGKPYYKKNNGEVEEALPDGYNIGKVRLINGETTDEFVEDSPSSNKGVEVAFSVLGKIVAKTGVDYKVYEKINVEVKKGSEIIDNVELNNMELPEVELTGGGSNSNSRCSF
jgi:type II secretory pathway pseudopilin PulG